MAKIVLQLAMRVVGGVFGKRTIDVVLQLVLEPLDKLYKVEPIEVSSHVMCVGMGDVEGGDGGVF